MRAATIRSRRFRRLTSFGGLGAFLALLFLKSLRNNFSIFSNADHRGVTGGHCGTPTILSGLDLFKPKKGFAP